MRIFITGGAGFIGSAAVEYLRERHDIMVYDNCSSGRAENVRPSIPLSINDINDTEELEISIRSFLPEVIVHLAAQPAISTSWMNAKYDAMVNTIGTLNLIKLAHDTSIRRIVFASTSAVYDEEQTVMWEDTRLFPNTPYGISKLAAERYVMTMLPESVVLRFGNVYGPRQVPLGENQVVPRMIRHFEYGDEFFIHGDGNQRRDFIFVEDVALAIFRAVIGKAGIYNIATGNSVSVNELAKLIEQVYEVNGYAWNHSPRQDTRRDARMRIEAAERDLHWKPRTPLLDGLKQTVAWWKTKKK